MTSMIWRKQVFERDFRCHRCGIKLWDETKGSPMKNLAFVPYETMDGEVSKILVCNRCHAPVGVISDKTQAEGEEWKDPISLQRKRSEADHDTTPQK